jgi:hypothetical protein
MDLYLLDNNFKRIGYVDCYESLIWATRYNTKGGVDLQIMPSQMFKKGYYLQRNDDANLMKINALEYKNNELIVGAEDCTCLLYQRVIWKTIVFSGTVEDFIREIIIENVIDPTNEARKIDNFELTEKKGFTDEIEAQTDYENVGEKIEELCKTYDYGFRVIFKDNKFYFDLYQGAQSKCVFSPEYENLGDTSFKTTTEDYHNACLVGGEGEGSDQILESVYIGATEPSGQNRYETFLDESSTSMTQDGTTIKEETYRKHLRVYGTEELMSTSTDEFEGEVVLQTYNYKTDYNLGDKVHIKDKYGNEQDVRIREVTETWDVDGYSIEISFDEDN